MGRPGRGGEQGGSVLETLLALLTGLLLVHLLLGTSTSVRRSVAALVEGSERLAAVRVARMVLGVDGVQAGPALHTDARAGVGDSLSLRAGRGGLLGCDASGKGWVVTWTGVRGPDPSKDSVAVLDEQGRESVHALRETAPPSSACGSALPGRALTLTLEPPVPQQAILGRYFERGSYHLTARALRYRRGAGGRQPLSAEVVETPASRFVRYGSAVRVRLVFDPVDSLARWLLPVSPGKGGKDEGGG